MKEEIKNLIRLIEDSRNSAILQINSIGICSDDTFMDEEHVLKLRKISELYGRIEALDVIEKKLKEIYNGPITPLP